MQLQESILKVTPVWSDLSLFLAGTFVLSIVSGGMNVRFEFGGKLKI